MPQPPPSLPGVEILDRRRLRARFRSDLNPVGKVDGDSKVGGRGLSG
jgi:hypothetical protein